MVLKKLGIALLAVFAMCALAASVSQANQWDINGAKMGAGTSESASASTTTTGVLAFKWIGSPFKFTWTGLESKEGKIVQTGSGASGVSTLSGKLVFTGVKVDEPAGCKTSSTIETVSLTGTAQMGNTAETAGGVYVKVVPKEGEVFWTLKLTECAAAGSYQFKGSFYVKANNPTGTAAVTQGGVTSGTITSSQGGALTFGKEAATLEGSINIALGGANLGKNFALTAE